MRKAGPSLEEAVRAKASGPSEARELADARQPKSKPRRATDSQFTERLAKEPRDLAKLQVQSVECPN